MDLLQGNLNKPTTSHEMVVVIRRLPFRRILGPDDFTTETHEITKEKVAPILFQLFQNIEQNGIQPNSLWGQVHSDNKNQSHDKKETTYLSFMNVRAKMLNKTSKSNPKPHLDQVTFILRIQQHSHIQEMVQITLTVWRRNLYFPLNGCRKSMW